MKDLCRRKNNRQGILKTMTVREFYQKLNELIPASLSCEWDNDGLMCCPDSARQASKVLVALDPSINTVRAAIDGGYDAIVTHHPLIFKGIKAIDDADMSALKLMCLLEANIAVMSFHTRLDAMEGGVNDHLASLLGLSQVEPLVNNGEKIGRVGVLPSPLNPEDMARGVKELLGAPVVRLGNAGRPAWRIALLGGSGDEEVDAAIAAGADTYISGSLKYHQLADARELGINLIEAGHFHTENHVCSVLRDMILSVDESIVCDIHSEYAITVI